MGSSNQVGFLNLLIGVLLILAAIAYLIYTKKEIDEDDIYTCWTLSYDIEIIFGTLVFLVIGNIMGYRALSKIRFE